MQAPRPVTVDLAAGIVTLGGMRVALERSGEQFVAPGGWPLRSLTFEERSRIVAGALIAPEPYRALLNQLRNLASVANQDDEMTDALLLAFAGGGEPASSFDDCARSACQNSGLDWRAVQKTSAVLVDQLAVSAEESSDDGWRRFEFYERPQGDLTLGDCCRWMLSQLLERGMPRADQQTPRFADAERSWYTQPEASVAAETDSSIAPLGDSTPTRVPNRPRPTEPLRARAALDQAARSQEAKAAPAISNALRAVALSPQWQHEVLPTEARSSDVNDASGPAAGPKTSPRLIQRDTTLRDAVNLEHTVTSSTAAAMQAPITAPDRGAVVSPSLPRLRAHRLRDLSFKSKPSAQLPIGEALASLSATASPVTHTLSDHTVRDAPFAVAPPQRDWIHEIATALSEECDLRGLDA